MRNEKSRELNPCFANDIIIVGTTMSGAAKLRWNANARDATHQRARNSDKWRKQSGILDCRWVGGHLIRVMRKHYLTKKDNNKDKDNDKGNDKDNDKYI